MKDNIKKLSTYRLKRAYETFEEGETLLKEGFFTGAVNRFYYAAFYAAKSLLILKGLDSVKHSGTISLFHEHFVRTNLMDKETAKALSRSFEQRQDSDYGDFARVTRQQADSLRRQVQAFIRECGKLLK